MALCTIAVALGVVGAVALVKRLAFRRRFGGGPWALASCGPGFGGHGCGGGDGYTGPWSRRGWGRFGGFGGGPGGTFWLRALFARLDTTPGQEREIRGAIEEFQERARDAKDGLKGAREHIAKAIGGESFDDVAVGDASGRADAAAMQIKDAFVMTLKRIHGVLDTKQRERLADLLARGGFGRRAWGNPYRDAAV
jgi:hypothetical protein